MRSASADYDNELCLESMTFKKAAEIVTNKIGQQKNSCTPLKEKNMKMCWDLF